METRQNAILLSNGTCFFPARNIDKSIYTQRCLANLVSQKREKNKSKFRMVNLGSGGTKGSVELWEIWKSELIFPSDKRNYSELS